MLNVKKLLELSIEERELEIYNELRKINVGEHIEKVKQGNIELSYLSWSKFF